MTQNAINTGKPVEIANGGTGQAAQTAAFDALSPTTTKGDLIVSDGSDNIRLAIGTDTHVYTADSGEASGTKWAVSSGGSGASVLPSHNGYETGGYYRAPNLDTALQASSFSVDTLFYIPIYISKSATFTTLGVYVISGEVSSAVRLGLYDTNADGEPNDLLDESTEVATTSGGWKEYTGMSEALSQQWYWLACVVNNDELAIRIYAYDDQIANIYYDTSDSTIKRFYTESHSFGALPSTASSLTGVASAAPCVLIGL